MVATIVYNVSLEYLFLFNADKSPGYCCDGNFGGGGVEGKMAPPMPYIINCDIILGSYI